jgi:hypothetical protein
MKSLLKKANEAVNGILSQTHMTVRRFITEDRQQMIVLMFPEEFTPPQAISLEKNPPPGWRVFFLDSTPLNGTEAGGQDGR